MFAHSLLIRKIEVALRTAGITDMVQRVGFGSRNYIPFSA